MPKSRVSKNSLSRNEVKLHPTFGFRCCMFEWLVRLHHFFSPPTQLAASFSNAVRPHYIIMHCDCRIAIRADEVRVDVITHSKICLPKMYTQNIFNLSRSRKINYIGSKSFNFYKWQISGGCQLKKQIICIERNQLY